LCGLGGRRGNAALLAVVKWKRTAVGWVHDWCPQLFQARRAGPLPRQHRDLRQHLAKPLLWAAACVAAVVEEGDRWGAAFGRWEGRVRTWAELPGPGTFSAQSLCLLLAVCASIVLLQNTGRCVQTTTRTLSGNGCSDPTLDMSLKDPLRLLTGLGVFCMAGRKYWHAVGGCSRPWRFPLSPA